MTGEACAPVRTTGRYVAQHQPSRTVRATPPDQSAAVVWWIGSTLAFVWLRARAQGDAGACSEREAQVPEVHRPAQDELVLASLRGQRTIAEICRDHDISETLLRTWRERFLARARSGVRARLSAPRSTSCAAQVSRLSGVCATASDPGSASGYVGGWRVANLWACPTGKGAISCQASRRCWRC
ncbi:MAG: hypothetical protein E6G41_07890 [Actinobacteria bacterium]|nr:MAG: hypothetical protein E6G41_07890 [Actinomycetota bacterium]